MATPIPVQIAAALATGIRSALATITEYPVQVIAAGVPNDDDGPGPVKYQSPRVSIRVSEASIDAYRSIFRGYPFSVMVATEEATDRRQQMLYAVAALVAPYLASAPIPTLTGAAVTGIEMQSPGDYEADEQGRQNITWTGAAHVQITTEEEA